MSYQETNSNTTTTVNLGSPSISAATSTTPQVPLCFTDQCPTASGSLKRRSPSSSFDQEPTPKRQSPSPSTATDHHPPCPSPTPILHRCYSDPVNSPGTKNPQLLNPNNHNSSPDKINKPPSPAPVCPLPSSLRRALSDVTAATTTTPPRPPSSRNLFPFSPCSGDNGSVQEGTPSAKKLKKMKEVIGEMSQWCNQLLLEAEQEQEEDEQEQLEDGSKENDHNPKDESEPENEELVSVDKAEGLVIYFDCPCGKGYQILFSGTDCYYKLM